MCSQLATTTIICTLYSCIIIMARKWWKKTQKNSGSPWSCVAAATNGTIGFVRLFVRFVCLVFLGPGQVKRGGGLVAKKKGPRAAQTSRKALNDVMWYVDKKESEGVREWVVRAEVWGVDWKRIQVHWLSLFYNLFNWYIPLKECPRTQKLWQLRRKYLHLCGVVLSDCYRA